MPAHEADRQEPPRCAVYYGGYQPAPIQCALRVHGGLHAGVGDDGQTVFWPVDPPLGDAKFGEIEAREKAATPGPWKLDRNFHCYIWGPQMQMVADDGMDEEGTLTRMRGVGANLPLKDNGEFIAHARTDIPALLQEIRRLTAAGEPDKPAREDPSHRR
jgi:hypothetical protein